MNTIKTMKPQKNKFDLSHEVKQTGNMGTLMPCFIQDVIPGDSFRVDTQQLIRFSPLLAPMMHNVDFKMDYFFVPYRLVWDQWKKFITGADDYDWQTDTQNDPPSYPRFEVNGLFRSNYLGKGQLADYLGVPPSLHSAGVEGGGWSFSGTGNNQKLSALPFRAYQLIYHEYFRDQNVAVEHNQYKTSGILSATEANATCYLRNTNWEKDYFTSALPFLQRGGDVNLPITGTLPVNFQAVNSTRVENNNPGVNFDGNLTSDAAPNNYIQVNNTGVSLDSSDNYSVDLADGVQITINELRKASALQQWLELMARAGSRYREQIHAIFGERIPDYTVQIPKYLGGGKTSIMISEVLSTYQSSNTSASSSATSMADRPVGDMAGHALGLGDGIGFTQSFDEHGIILGLCRVVPKASYVQGLSRFWQKFDKFDHYFPQFANLGEQEVYNKELYVTGKTGEDDTIFGYQQRYAEYKYSQNRIAGDFRDTLAHWELSRRFTAHPVLNESFIHCNPDDRIFAITDANEDKIWMSLYHKVDALRPIPYHSIPSLT